MQCAMYVAFLKMLTVVCVLCVGQNPAIPPHGARWLTADQLANILSASISSIVWQCAHMHQVMLNFSVLTVQELLRRLEGLQTSDIQSLKKSMN